jgi:hypothetical protein
MQDAATGQVQMQDAIMERLDARFWSWTGLMQDASHGQAHCKMLVMKREV